MPSIASKQSTTETTAKPLAQQAGLSHESSAPADQMQRHAMIAEAAVFIADARGFAPNQELQHWLAAEREIEQRFAGSTH